MPSTRNHNRRRYILIVAVVVCVLSECLADVYPWFSSYPGQFLDKSAYDDPDDAVNEEYASISGLRCAFKCYKDDDCTGFNHQGARISDIGHCQLMTGLESDENEFLDEAISDKAGYTFYDKCKKNLFLVAS